MMIDTNYLHSYEEKLTEIVVSQCTSKNFLDGRLLEVEELEEKWSQIAPEYMVDAVPEVKDYPSVAIAWAAYVGMGMAAMWDGDWEEYKDRKDLYKGMREPRGFDGLDDYVKEEFLGLELDTEECKAIDELLLGCARSAMAIIRNEKFEPQSADAFYIFASTAKVFFRLGVAVELKQLGYKYEKVTVVEKLN